MKRLLIAMIAIALSSMLVACNDDPPSAKSVQAQRAHEAANSINFAENAEIDNIKARLTLTSNPGLTGFVLLMNEMGQPIMYVGVKGKITSGSKRLTEPDRYWTNSQSAGIRAGSSDEGTFGSSGEYVFFWTTDGQYIQWNGKYLYSDKPFRVKIEPLVVAQADTK